MSRQGDEHVETMAPSWRSTPSMKRSWRCRSRLPGTWTALWATDRQRAWQRTGLTVGLPGSAPPRPCAKLANYAAKKWPATRRRRGLRDEELRRARLDGYHPVDEVWGMGRRWALSWHKASTPWLTWWLRMPRVTRQYGVVVERIVQELRGLPLRRADR